MSARGTGKLTQDQVNRALMKSTPFTLRDGNGLLLTRGKRKLGWYHEYRLSGRDSTGRRRSKKLTLLAEYSPACRLAEARKLNAAARLKVADGHDVLAEHLTERIANIARAETEGMTMCDLIRSFVTARGDNWRPSTVRSFRDDLEIIDAALGSSPVRTITRARLTLLLQEFVAEQQARGRRGTRCERLRMHLGSLFNYALISNWSSIRRWRV